MIVRSKAWREDTQAEGLEKIEDYTTEEGLEGRVEHDGDVEISVEVLFEQQGDMQR